MSAFPELLRALSVRQPWAELILRGHKTVEYRSQATHVRGRVYLYASLSKPDPADALSVAPLALCLDDLPRGVIVGTVELVGCELGDDGYEWQLAHPQRLDTPLTPREQPQAVWFYPFGPPPDDAPLNTEHGKGVRTRFGGFSLLGTARARRPVCLWPASRVA